MLEGEQGEEPEGEANSHKPKDKLVFMRTLARQDARAMHIVVTGTLSMCSHEPHALFDLTSTHCYVSLVFSKCFF